MVWRNSWVARRLAVQQLREEIDLAEYVREGMGDLGNGGDDAGILPGTAIGMVSPSAFRPKRWGRVVCRFGGRHG